MGTLDDSRATVRQALVGIARGAAVLSLAVLAAAHVGSPNVYFAGKAGPYTVDVAIRPPQVVPGVAEVLVKVSDTLVTQVVVRPVFWRAGSKGAPPGDDAKPVPGSRGTFTGQLWLMASGAYSVTVVVFGPKGPGTVMVPVASVATGQLALSPFLKWLLVALGTLLVAGAITAVHAAVGESQVAPGEMMPPERRRRARTAALVTVPLLAFILFGGASWWDSEAQRYTRTLYRPLLTRTAVTVDSFVPVLTQTVIDPNWRAGNATAVMPDHGKLAHMFVVRADSPYVFAHLHPSMPDRSTLVTPLPAMPAGRYRVFTDLVQESGFERTLVDSFTLKVPVGAGGTSRLTEDEAWSSDVVNKVGVKPEAGGHDTTFFIKWDGPSRVVARQPGVLRFLVSDRRQGEVEVQPYLGMLGHAVVLRDDGKVFVHLHPSGTASMASQLAFALRDRGDTTKEGRLQLDAKPMRDMASTTPLKYLGFPYAFPTAGQYRVWVQVRTDGRVHTSGFEVHVVEPDSIPSR
ncbi:MAG: hypothetical protein ABJE47_04525 [bacterium]